MNKGGATVLRARSYIELGELVTVDDGAEIERAGARLHSFQSSHAN